MAKQRFKETVNINPVDTRTGAVQGLMSLADRLDNFKNLGSQIAQVGFQAREQKLTARGTATGGAVPLERNAEGITTQPELKEKTWFGDIESGAHNRALQSAYLGSLNNDIRTNVARMTQSTVFKKLSSMWARCVDSSSATALTLHRLALCTANPTTAARRIAMTARDRSTPSNVPETRFW